MSLQMSVAVRNAMADAIETQIGVSAVLKIRTGAAPATCATADAGTVLATLNLPSDSIAAALAPPFDFVERHENRTGESGDWPPSGRTIAAFESEYFADGDEPHPGHPPE